MQKYNFTEFLASMAKLDHDEILRRADAECDLVERRSYGRKGAVREREFGSSEYAEQIKAFLFFMRSGSRPYGASDEDFQNYRPVVEALVQKGQIKPETLSAFS